MSTYPSLRSSYQKPQLKRYGDIKTLTQNFAVEGLAFDGGGQTAVPNKTD